VGQVGCGQFFEVAQPDLDICLRLTFE